MTQIADIFIKNKSSIGNYKGEEIRLSMDIPIKSGDALSFKFLSVNSDWRQGVSLIILSKKTKITVNGIITNESNTLWQDTAPQEVIIKVVSVDPKKPFIRVANAWKSKDKLINFPNLGGAMKVHNEDGKIVFYCNDGKDDDDFDDLIFTMAKAQ